MFIQKLLSVSTFLLAGYIVSLFYISADLALKFPVFPKDTENFPIVLVDSRGFVKSIDNFGEENKRSASVEVSMVDQSKLLPNLTD